IGENCDGQEGVGKVGCAGVGPQRGVAAGVCGGAIARKLSAGEAAVEAVCGRRRGGSEASQRRAAVESRLPGEVPAQGAGAGAEEIQRAGGRALRPDAGGRASGGGRRAGAGRGDAAALDAGGGGVEPGAEGRAASASKRAQGALRGGGTEGRELSRLAGGARCWQ